MNDWYDKKVNVQSFAAGDEVYFLNIRLYKGRSPKWMRGYSHMATVVKRLKKVTDQLQCPEWMRKKTQIVHVDKMKLLATAAAVAAEKAAE